MAAFSDETFFRDPVICYFLDSILIVYCIVATALFFMEKFSHIREPEDNDCIYQELQTLKDADIYHEIKPSKGKKKAAKKKKSRSAQVEESDPDPFESPIPGGSGPPPLPPIP